MRRNEGKPDGCEDDELVVRRVTTEILEGGKVDGSTETRRKED